MTALPRAQNSVTGYVRAPTASVRVSRRWVGVSLRRSAPTTPRLMPMKTLLRMPRSISWHARKHEFARQEHARAGDLEAPFLFLRFEQR